MKLYPEVSLFLGSTNAAILYQRLYDLAPLGKRADGFIYKTMDELRTETGLSRREQDSARKLLVERGWLEVVKKRANGHATLHYRPMMELVRKSSTNAPNRQTRKNQSAKLNAPKRQSNNTRSPLDNSLERDLLIKKMGMG